MLRKLDQLGKLKWTLSEETLFELNLLGGTPTTNVVFRRFYDKGFTSRLGEAFIVCTILR